MNSLLTVYKPTGYTPLELITQLRRKHPEYAKVKIAYAGRLDPMAHGVMLLMIGDATRSRDQYLRLTKSYEFEALFGIDTDTYDLLGLVHESAIKPPASNVNLIVNSYVNSHHGKLQQAYPPYSSKTVQGKPLFLWSKEQKLDQIIIPSHEIEIFDFQIIKRGEITKKELQSKIKTEVESVNGDFRQEQILHTWQNYFNSSKAQSFSSISFSITCSSGTYIRSLVHELGQRTKTGAVCSNILRTKIGTYSLNDALRVF